MVAVTFTDYLPKAINDRVLAYHWQMRLILSRIKFYLTVVSE